jgi:hypothetical protein
MLDSPNLQEKNILIIKIHLVYKYIFSNSK